MALGLPHPSSFCCGVFLVLSAGLTSGPNLPSRRCSKPPVGLQSASNSLTCSDHPCKMEIQSELFTRSNLLIRFNYSHSTSPVQDFSVTRVCSLLLAPHCKQAVVGWQRTLLLFVISGSPPFPWSSLSQPCPHSRAKAGLKYKKELIRVPWKFETRKF